MAPTQKATSRTKRNSANTSFGQSAIKPTDNIKSEVFKMKRTFMRTFSAIDHLIKQKFGKDIIESVNELDAPSKEKLQSKSINELFTQMDTDIGAIIQPPKPVTVNPLAQDPSEVVLMAKQQATITNLKNQLEKANAENMALKQQNQDKDASQEDNDLLNMPTEE